MAFSDLASGLNKSCLSSFGQQLVFTPQAPGAEPSTITGILETGVELEQTAPGDGSIYVRLWLNSSAIVPAPQKGDEISSATTVYKILRIEEDAGGGTWLLLRQDRAVP
jgi:hypothetical protein